MSDFCLGTTKLKPVFSGAGGSREVVDLLQC